MAILVNLEHLLLQQKINSIGLAAKINITKTNLSILKTNKAKLIRFSTLDSICRILNCQPGDILKYVPDNETS
ncbi:MULTISPECIES: helix-turn-helix domain-containing protein [Clostridia]|jgi:putative transcriptional regulator|uniref:Transcriptional regulator n=2 Tax=Geosporobacter TaxID=390805 RepID=A0A1D8GCU2_9FIRM|nr:MULTISPECIES: helix-turn-helix transcriptional regulator [Clostridia]AOT68728.1 transcriptional regulator [Geosporobacter ferrireducens]SHJ88809.1 putative transcriptional regulator [Geosporobacter subterraneus DSM 17957]